MKQKNGALYKILSISCIIAVLFSACDSASDRMKNVMRKMRSVPVNLSLDKMECWTTDSILLVCPWKHAKYKLVHYVDSTTCSTCYLQKMALQEELFSMEKETDNGFYNIFVVDPAKNNSNIQRLKLEYDNKKLPSTIFLDSGGVFSKENPNIPKEFLYHTFLLDKKNNVVFIGNPIANPSVKKKMYDIIRTGLK